MAPRHRSGAVRPRHRRRGGGRLRVPRRTEGIIPAIESAHAVAHARKLAPTMGKDQSIVITISGRGDKDCAAIARYKGEDLHE